MNPGPVVAGEPSATAGSGLMTSLVIPVYNQLDYTRRCLDSIQRWTDVPFEVIVVDNASADGTRDYLKTVPAQVIANDSNLGCAKAWNQGVRASTGQVIGILNNDIVVTPGWLRSLLAFMQSGRYGIVSPSAREGPLDYDLERYAAEFTRRCAGAIRKELYGACMVIDRRVFEQVGLFDEAFTYGGCEDVDFLWRAREAGWQAAMTGSVLIHHFSMVTQDAIKNKQSRTYPTANLAHFTAKWNRTVRGNWLERRWTGLRSVVTARYERLRYGHTLIEKPTPAGASASGIKPTP